MSNMQQTLSEISKPDIAWILTEGESLLWETKAFEEE